MSDINAGFIALLNVTETSFAVLERGNFGNNKLMRFDNIIELCQDYEKLKLNIVAIISESEVMGTSGVNLLEILYKRDMKHIPLFLLVTKVNENLSRICLQSGVADVFTFPLSLPLIETRINFIIKNWTTLQNKTDWKKYTAYKTPLLKRSFDVVTTCIALILLSPILLLVMVLMKLESKGPIFYYSLRVGTGYRIFKFYKFRSMYVNADQRLKELQHLNQYAGNKVGKQTEDGKGIVLCEDCAKAGNKCRNQIFADKITWCEKQYLSNKKNSGSAFFKLKNDPRVTKVGHFIRNTSIDELPQLWNVLKGDMSIVGNRPLPLYEAEKLTTDKYALRFLAPAGITGLWQVEKRGKGEMSEDERLMLDNSYAANHSFWYDIKLILKTIPALLQKENV
jgi:lipopolysaccharide/colanic/teichoic acid biosynthesis glycosyltransferase